MKHNNNLTKSEDYLEKLDMEKLTASVKDSMSCPDKIAFAIARLISAKIYLELVCDEEQYQDYIVQLEEELDIPNVKKTLH
tara:strand:- start:28 stop:270 length:243 start_codon:yes stop_codon:yes gene_type:complete